MELQRKSEKENRIYKRFQIVLFLCCCLFFVFFEKIFLSEQQDMLLMDPE